LQLRFDEFTFRLKPEQHEMELTDTVRVEAAVEYKTRAWQTIEVDLGPGEARAVDLVTPAIEVCRKWACPSIVKYVVLGSMSKWRRSFMRVPVLKGKIAPATYLISSLWICSANWTTCACGRRNEFSAREIPIRFPPETILPTEWLVELETLAAELGYRTTKAAEIQKEFTRQSTDASDRTVGITLIQILLVRTRPSFATIWLPFVDVYQLRVFCCWPLLRP
jgi:hypothetical protein